MKGNAKVFVAVLAQAGVRTGKLVEAKGERADTACMTACTTIELRSGEVAQRERRRFRVHEIHAFPHHKHKRKAKYKLACYFTLPKAVSLETRDVRPVCNFK